jgi:hypothetical protein
MIIDAWMQHPTERFLRHEMFASLRRWTGGEIPEGELPIAATVAAMDAGARFHRLAHAAVAVGDAANRSTLLPAVACVELGVPFCTQVGHTGPLRPSEPGRPIPYIDQIAIDFPELTIVGGHIGYPWTEEMIAVARKHEKTGSGRHKVLFGSNYPMILPQAALEALDTLELVWSGGAGLLRIRCSSKRRVA